MRVAGQAAPPLCLAAAALAQAPRAEQPRLAFDITPGVAGSFALRAESSIDGGPGLEDGTIDHKRLR
jgi:hypothetical protein